MSLLNQRLELAGSVEVTEQGETFRLTDIVVIPNEIFFNVMLPDGSSPDDEWWHPPIHRIEIDLINYDGTESAFLWSGGSGGMWTERDDGVWVRETSIIGVGSVIDLDNLAAIRFNGVTLEVQ